MQNNKKQQRAKQVSELNALLIGSKILSNKIRRDFKYHLIFIDSRFNILIIIIPARLDFIYRSLSYLIYFLVLEINFKSFTVPSTVYFNLILHSSLSQLNDLYLLFAWITLSICWLQISASSSTPLIRYTYTLPLPLLSSVSQRMKTVEKVRVPSRTMR